MSWVPVKLTRPQWVQHLRVSGRFRISGLLAVCLVVVALSMGNGCLTSEYLELGSDVGDFQPFPVLLCLTPAIGGVEGWAWERVMCLRCLRDAPSWQWPRHGKSGVMITYGLVTR